MAGDGAGVVNRIGQNSIAIAVWDAVVYGAPAGFAGWMVDLSTVNNGAHYYRWWVADGSAQRHIIDRQTGEPTVTAARSGAVQVEPRTSPGCAASAYSVHRGSVLTGVVIHFPSEVGAKCFRQHIRCKGVSHRGVMLETVLADVAQQLLQVGNLHHCPTAECL